MSALQANTTVLGGVVATGTFTGAASEPDTEEMLKNTEADNPLDKARKIVRDAISIAKQAFPETQYNIPVFRAGLILKGASDLLGQQLYSPDNYKRTDAVVWINTLSLKKAMDAALDTSNVNAQAAALVKIEEVVAPGSKMPWRHAGIPALAIL